MAQTKIKPKRALAWLLTLCMVFGMLPMTAFAEEVEVDSSVVTAFEPLGELTANQYWGVGTSIEELILLDTLTVTVTSGAALAVTLTEDIAVSEWQSTPVYDPDTLGTYVFTPTLDLPKGYSVAEGVELPQIEVVVFTPMGFAASATEISVSDFSALQTAITNYKNASDDTVITVTADMTVDTAVLFIPTNINGKTLTIKGSASTIKLTRGSFITNDLISVGDSGNPASKLILENITIDGGSFSSGINGALVYVNTGCTFTMNDGVTLQNNTRSSGNGSGVINEGTFIMNGGKITDCKVTMNYTTGGGVRNDGTFTMNGGEISGNTAATNGGGVHIAGGTFTISGTPKIEKNKKGTVNPEEDTGGVYLGSSRTIAINRTTPANGLESGAKIGIEGMATTTLGTTVVTNAVDDDLDDYFYISSPNTDESSNKYIGTSGNKCYLGFKSSAGTIVLKGAYSPAPSKTVNIQTNIATAQSGSLAAADFFTTAPTGANITNITQTTAGAVVSTPPELSSGTLSYESGANLTTSSAESVYSVTIASDNYFDITATLTFVAADKTNVSDKITFTPGSKVYTGSEQDCNAASIVGITAGDNPTWTYAYTAGTGTLSNNKPQSAGTYNVTVTYEDSTNKGTATGTFTIDPKNLSSVAVTATFPTTTYTGSAQSPSPTEVKFDGTVTTEYTLGAYSDNTNAGTASVVINGAGNYTGMATVNFTIAPKNLTDVDIVANFPATTYNGSAQTPAPSSVTFDGVSKSVTTDYTLGAYSSNTNAGTASVVLNGAGNYTGTASVNFTIGTVSLTLVADNKTILINDAEPTYTYSVTGLVGSDTKETVITTQPTMSVAGFNSSSATTFDITISGGATTNANYTIDTRTNGTLTVTSKTSATVTVTAPSNITYGGTLGNPSASADGGGSDYTYTYNYTGTLSDGSNTAYDSATKPTEPGSYTVTATLVSATHTGTGTATFTIAKKDLSWVAGTASNKTYDGGTSATAASHPTLNGIINSDTVAVTNGTAAFASANAANGIAVTGSGYGVSGDHAWKYNAPSTQPGLGTANITKVNISINTVAALSKTYDGTLDATAGAVTFSGLVNSETFAVGTDYTVAAAFTGDANVASSTKNYTYTVTMLSTTKANNYSLATATKTGSDGTISKAAKPSNVTHTLTFIQSTAASQSVTLTDLLPTQTSPMAYGTPTYTVGTITGDNILDAPATGATLTSPLTVTVKASAVKDNTATIPITVTSTNFADFAITITVNVTDQTKEATPDASIDYVAEKLTGLTANEKYSINGGADVTADASSKIDIVSGWLGTSISIVKKGITASSTIDSDAQSLDIPARPAAPTPTGGAGQITGVTTAMEYKLSTASTWTACSGTTVTGLAAGTYNVRMKAVVSTSFASVSADVTVTAASFTITFNANGGSISPATMQTGAEGKLASLPTPSRSGSYSFDGWYTAASGGTQITTNTLFTVNTTVYAHWTYTGGSSGGDNGGSSGGGSTPTPKPDPTPAPTTNPTPAPTTNPDNSSNVLVDGKEVSAGTVETKGDAVTVTVNQETIQKQLETATDNVTVIVPVDEKTGTAAAQFVVKNVDDMAEKEMTLTVQVGNVQYELPTTAVDTAAVLASLGASNSADVPISITVTTNVSEKVQTAVNSAIEANGNELVIPPMEFKITATYEGKTVEIDTFSQYVSRSVEITAEQAQKVTTAIVVNPDGTSYHVPTRVYQKDGKWYAEVNSLTNSTYALVYNEKTFTDAKGKWYETAVNEMASRMVISGVGENQFAGERDITRSEFAAIIVKALGLPTNGNGSVFTDVSRSAWYCGSVGTAYEYGIISGVGDNKYDPNRAITRQEAMIMVQRAAKLAGFKGNTGNINSFTDAGNVSSWALEAAMWNVGSGLVSGFDGKLNPLNNITRAETATLVLSLLQKSGLVDVRNNKPLASTNVNSEATYAVVPGKENDPMQLLGSDSDDINA